MKKDRFERTGRSVEVKWKERIEYLKSERDFV